MSYNICSCCGAVIAFNDRLEDGNGNSYHIECFANMLVGDSLIMPTGSERKAEATAVLDADLMEEALAKPYRRYNNMKEVMNL